MSNYLSNRNDGRVLLDPTISKQIADIEKQVKELKDAQDRMKSALLEEMEQKGIKKVETDDVVITYVGATDKENFDKKSFKTDYPDIYDNYISLKTASSYVKIKVK